MRIGMIDFNNPKRIFKNRIERDNLKDCIYDYWLERRHVILRCECGQILAPFVELVGPRACGWQKIKKKWKCHQCSAHNRGYWDGSPSDRKEFKKNIEEKNKKIIKQITRYKMFHPWIHIKEL